jgi:pentatricopeptide repeat protein
MHEYAKEAHGHFEQMLEKGGEINHITFVSLLSACSYACLVDEGLHYFDLMSSCFSISATVEHYAFTVDLLGYIGHLQEAEHLIMPMSCEPNTTVWTVLLHACKSHGNVEMGECVAKQAMQIGPGNAFYRRQ